MDQINITRRVFIGSIAFFVSAPLLAHVSNKQTGLLEISEAGQFFSAHELTVLTDIAQIMIPTTDTPGATEAHVIPVLDALMLTWASEETKLRFKQVVEQVGKLAIDSFQLSYQACSQAQRESIIKQIDKRAFANTSSAISVNYRKLKEMIFHVYYTSEEANPDFVLIPGTYKGCLSKTEYEQIVNERLGRTS